MIRFPKAAPLLSLLLFGLLANPRATLKIIGISLWFPRMSHHSCVILQSWMFIHARITPWTRLSFALPFTQGFLANSLTKAVLCSRGICDIFEQG